MKNAYGLNVQREENMKDVLPLKWTPEWFSLTTTEELMRLLHEAKQLEYHHKPGSLWMNRISRLEAELESRQFEEQIWKFERRPL
jgi:hypothetical protein